ncbi:hypothetical protein GQ568_02780 [Patescibacteria group bacterium]|nr:hypothetical protein [Patescibacteria group bacterium]
MTEINKDSLVEFGDMTQIIFGDAGKYAKLKKILNAKELNFFFKIKIDFRETNKRFEIKILWRHPRIEYADDKKLAQNTHLSNKKTMEMLESYLEENEWTVNTAKEMFISGFQAHIYKNFMLEAFKHETTK